MKTPKAARQRHSSSLSSLSGPNMKQDASTTLQPPGHANILEADFMSPLDSKEPIEANTSKKIILFGFDISAFTPSIQFAVLMSGLILFMCLYGYFQELVVYGWFDRKLSLFSTFMHFLGCSVFAIMQRRILCNPNINVAHHRKGKEATSPAPSHNSYDFEKDIGKELNGSNVSSINDNNIGLKESFWTISMGTAPTHIALGYYTLQIVLKTAGQGLANLSMTHINYPAKVLFKSANPVVTMIIGIFWFRRSYAIRDYVVVLLLVLGLYIFITTDTKNSPTGTKLGVFYVIISMFFGASVPMLQEHCMSKYSATPEELLYYSFLGSTVFSLILALYAGELIPGLIFFVETGNVRIWVIFFLFSSVGFFGANFSTLLTQRFGSLVNGIANTIRKAITLGLSFALFPERNVLTLHHVIGASVFMSGLVLRIVFKENSNYFTRVSEYIYRFIYPNRPPLSQAKARCNSNDIISSGDLESEEQLNRLIYSEDLERPCAHLSVKVGTSVNSNSHLSEGAVHSRHRIHMV